MTAADGRQDQVSLEDSALERWEAISFLQKVTTIVPSVIYVFNQKTQSNEYTNRSLPESMGYLPREIQEMGPSFMPRVCHPEDLPVMGSYFAALRQMADGEVSQLEYRMRHRDGRWRWVLSYDTIFERDESGEVLRHIGVATDITAQKEAELKLQKANQALELINAELADLAYVASHDMKGPINNIVGLATRLLRMEAVAEAPGAQPVLELMLQCCEQANSKLRDVVKVTQARELHRSAPRERLDLSTVFEQACKARQETIEEFGAEIEADFAAAPTLLFSPVLFQSVLENLLDNAIKYRKPGEPPRIGVSSTTSASGDFRLVIRDDGVGFDGDRYGQEIFRLFKRLSRSSEGSGIGLYMVRQIVTRAGGEVSVASQPGMGATFTLTLPQGDDG